MFSLRSGTSMCILALMLESALAQDSSFHHRGGLSANETRNRFYSAWNPSGSKDLFEPGVKVVFFGSAPTCFQVIAGPVSGTSRYSVHELSRDTGLAPGPEIEKTLLTPAADPKHCHADHEGQREGSFVVRGSTNRRSGIGLYTTAGPDDNGRRPLIDTFDSRGQSGSGANAGIAGTFVIFRFDWEKAPFVNLWSTLQPNEDPGAAVLQIATTQTVATVSVGVISDSPTSSVKQVKQQLTVTLINPECRRVLSRSGKLCQIQYLLTLGIVRSGVKDWDQVGWFHAARLWVDPAQGNMPVIDGPVRAKGQVTQDASRKFDLYSSADEETGHDTFKDRSFRIRLGFGQFKNALRLATATQLSKAPDAVSAEEVAQTFGPQWNDPSSWTLLSVEVGQEIYNPSPKSEAHIGGSFKEIGIGS